MRKISFLVLILFLNTSFSLEITNYSADDFGLMHEVTVAFDNLDKSGYVRCVLKKSGKPIAMKKAYVQGVHTFIFTPPVAKGLTASCKEL